MKIKVDAEGKHAIYGLIDIALKASGLNGLNGVNQILGSIELVKEEKKEDKK